MTNEEAIYEIKNTPISEILTHPRFKEALDMAIEALELHDIIAEMLENAQPVIETDGDLISREDALQARPEYLNPNQEKLASYNQGWNNAIDEYFFGIKELQSADGFCSEGKRPDPKWLYRLESVSPDNGLWYDSNGRYVWGCKDCTGEAKNLPMTYDERYHVYGKNWFSSCSNKEDLLHWYSLEDANYLIEHGFVFTKYLATDYIEYPTKETVFLKETALLRQEMDINELFAQEWREEP